MQLIRSESFSGTVEHFRALMQRLAVQYAKGWESVSGERLVFSEHRHTRRQLIAVTPRGDPRLLGTVLANREHYRDVDNTRPTRGSWKVYLLVDKSFKGNAGIEAYEGPDGSTRVDFYDGYDPLLPGLDHAPIREAFEKFCEMVVREIQPATNEQAERQVEGGEVGEEKGGRIPDEPNIEHTSHDEWFDWYSAAKRAGSRITLERLSGKMGLSHNYVRKLHVEYKAHKAQNTPQK